MTIKYFRREEQQTDEYFVRRALSDFIDYVKAGVTPPEELLQFVAKGAQAKLNGVTPWYWEKAGRPRIPPQFHPMAAVFDELFPGRRSDMAGQCNLSPRRIGQILGEAPSDPIAHGIQCHIYRAMFKGRDMGYCLNALSELKGVSSE